MVSMTSEEREIVFRKLRFIASGHASDALWLTPAGAEGVLSLLQSPPAGGPGGWRPSREEIAAKLRQMAAQNDVAWAYAQVVKDAADLLSLSPEPSAEPDEQASEFEAKKPSAQGKSGRTASISLDAAEPDSRALERAARAFLEEYDTYRPGRPEAGRQREAMKAALLSLKDTNHGR